MWHFVAWHFVAPRKSALNTIGELAALFEVIISEQTVKRGENNAIHQSFMA
jgi:hypothetical protein